jgi:hypothetical protein
MTWPRGSGWGRSSRPRAGPPASLFAAPPVGVAVEPVWVGSDDANGCDPERPDVGAVEIGRSGRYAAAGVVRIAVPRRWRRDGPRRRRFHGRPALSGRNRVVRVENRCRTRSPEPTSGSPGLLRGAHQLPRVPASLGTVEVRGPDPTAHELEIHVERLALDVPKEAPVAIDRVEPGIRLQRHSTSRRCECEQRGSRGPRVTLARAELGRVDLKKPHSPTVAKRQGVAVGNGRDDASGRLLRAGNRSTERTDQHGDTRTE